MTESDAARRHRPQRAPYALPRGFPALERRATPRALLLAGCALALLGVAAGFVLGCCHV